MIDLAQQDLASFQQTVDLSEQQVRAGALSEGDAIKIKLQLLQFQNDVSSAKLSRVQALAALRQLVGFESVPENYDVEGTLDYQPVHGDLEALKMLAVNSRARSGGRPRRNHRRPQSGVARPRQRQARPRRQLQLLPRRRHQFRSLLLQHANPRLRPQSRRNRPHPRRHHAIPGTSRRSQRASDVGRA